MSTIVVPIPIRLQFLLLLLLTFINCSLGAPDSREVVTESPQDRIPNKFDHDSYDFMIAEGNVPESSTMAVITFITEKNGRSPQFQIENDSNDWFTIGHVEFEKAANADVYNIDLNLRKGARISVANGMSYAFKIVAKVGEETLAETGVNADLIALSPTTQRIKTTTEDIESSGDMEGSANFADSPHETRKPESSIELLTDTENPLVNVKVVSEEMTPTKIRLDMLGIDDERRLLVNEQMGDNYQIRGFYTRFSSTDGDEARLSVSPSDLFAIHPQFVSNGDYAAVFVKDSSRFAERSTMQLQISAQLSSGEKRTESLIISNSVPRESSKTSSSVSTPINVNKLVLSIPESAENGYQVSHFDSDVRLIGDNAFVSLIDNNLVVTCGESRDCLSSGRRFDVFLEDTSSLNITHLVIEVTGRPSVRTTDKLIRISDTNIIAPFAVIAENAGELKLGGNASHFLRLKSDDRHIYEVVVTRPASTGRYLLTIGDIEVNVFVESSINHAHFRQPEYTYTIDGSHVTREQIGQVELEGIPIDEAKIMIADGNSASIAVSDYGGKVHVSRDQFEAPEIRQRLVAVDRRTRSVLAETWLNIHVDNWEKPEERKRQLQVDLLEIQFDRENDEMRLEIGNEWNVDKDSIVAVNENGRKVLVKPEIFVKSANSTIIDKSLASDLRLLSAHFSHAQHKKLVFIRFTSTVAYLERQQKLRARPVFPSPWSRDSTELDVNVLEEQAAHQTIAVMPAVFASNFSHADVQCEHELFYCNQTTGEIKMSKSIDFDSTSRHNYELQLRAGEKGFETTLDLHIHLLNLDDLPPLVDGIPEETLKLSESSEPGTIIREMTIIDTDSPNNSSFSVSLSGIGSNHYETRFTSGNTFELLLKEPLDREIESMHSLTIQVADESGNSKKHSILIEILDENDNSPTFEQTVYNLEIVEDWPIGYAIDKIHAIDGDLDDAARLTYSLLPIEIDFLSINPNTGVVALSKQLTDVARREPYHFQVNATDHGQPPRSSMAQLTARIVPAADVQMGPIVEFVKPMAYDVLNVQLRNNTKIDKIYTAQAIIRGITRNENTQIDYSVQQLEQNDDEIALRIDKNSGDVYLIDQKKNEHETTYLIEASIDDEVKASSILGVVVDRQSGDLLDFGESLPEVVRLNSTIAEPGVVYQILPNCGSNADQFEIDENGRIISRNLLEKHLKYELCLIGSYATAIDLKRNDVQGKNVRKVIVAVEDEKDEYSPVYMNANATRNVVYRIDNFGMTKIGDNLQNVIIPMNLNTNNKRNINATIEEMNFVPAQFELGRDISSPNGTIDINMHTGELVANENLLAAPQGVYSARIRANEHVALKQIHHVSNMKKLKYTLDMNRDEIGANFESFRTQLIEAIWKETESNSYDVFFDEPVRNSHNSSWTNICFYITKNNEILDESRMTQLLNRNNAHNTKIRHIYKVASIDSCVQNDVTNVTNDKFGVQSNLFMIVSFLLVLIYILVCLIVFVCCVHRHKQYYRRKTEKIQDSASASYYSARTIYASQIMTPTPPMY